METSISDSEIIHAVDLSAVQDNEILSTDGESWKFVDDSSDDDSESADNDIVKWGSQLDMEAGEMENSFGEFTSEKDSSDFVEQEQEVTSLLSYVHNSSGESNSEKESLISIDDAEMDSNVSGNPAVAELPSTSSAVSFPLVIRNNNASRKLAKNIVQKKNTEMKNATNVLKTRAFLNCRISSGASPDSNLHLRNKSPKFGNTKIISPTTVESATRQEFVDKVKKALKSDTTFVEVKCIANVPPTVTQVQASKSNQINGAGKTAGRCGTSSQKLPTLFSSNLYWVNNPPKTSNTNANKQELITRKQFAAKVKKALSGNDETSVKVEKLESLEEERPISALTLKVRQDLRDFIDKAVQNDTSLCQKQSDLKTLDNHNVDTSIVSVLKNPKRSNSNMVVKRPCVKCGNGDVWPERDNGSGKRWNCKSQRCDKSYKPFISEFQRTKNSPSMSRSQTYSASNGPFLNLGIPNPQDAATLALARIMRFVDGNSNSDHSQRSSTTKPPSFGEIPNPQEAETTNFVNILKEEHQNLKHVNSEVNNAELEENAPAIGNILDAVPPPNCMSEDENYESEADSEEFNPIVNEPEDRMSENENSEDEGFDEENVEENDAFFWRCSFINLLLLMIVILTSFNFGCFFRVYISMEEESRTLQSSIGELQSEISRLRHKNFVITRQLSSMIERFNIPTGSDPGSIAVPPETFLAKFLLLLATIHVHLDHLFTGLVNQISKYDSSEQFLLYLTCFGGFLVMCYLVTRIFSLVRKLVWHFVRRFK
ncbi:hypothetical protein DdX_12078 [Ditylenchus destructor]|uniref:Uncharacterized protein n=1 Tax=Ditylenchus destructor TaxID=166010 RepID=A0AAD4R3U8_9BILA|nr:hypothetical protein DdX_12078 [Ditylenchus destructor]